MAQHNDVESCTALRRVVGCLYGHRWYVVLQSYIGCVVVVQCHFFFFFSSRRRHTRFDCDWSSDVCSSDLIHVYEGATLLGTTTTTWFDATLGTGDHTLRVELRNNDHSPLTPAVTAQITVQDRKSVV